MNEDKNEDKESNKKEEVASGVLIASIIFSLSILILLLILFAWPPISFLSSKWNNYWDEPTAYSIVINDNEEDGKRKKANDDCKNKTKKYFNSPEVASYASTINKYETYTCYGVNWTQIPND